MTISEWLSGIMMAVYIWLGLLFVALLAPGCGPATKGMIQVGPTNIPAGTVAVQVGPTTRPAIEFVMASPIQIGPTSQPAVSVTVAAPIQVDGASGKVAWGIGIAVAILGIIVAWFKTSPLQKPLSDLIAAIRPSDQPKS